MQDKSCNENKTYIKSREEVGIEIHEIINNSFCDNCYGKCHYYNISQWKVSGDFFDVCKCNIPCPCTFVQAPTYGDCDGVLAYHIKNGYYGDTSLDGLNVLGLGYFKGNIWAGRRNSQEPSSLMNELINNKEMLCR